MTWNPRHLSVGRTLHLDVQAYRQMTPLGWLRGWDQPGRIDPYVAKSITEAIGGLLNAPDIWREGDTETPLEVSVSIVVRIKGEPKLWADAD